MKVVISAVILAVAILMGSYFDAEANRYDVVTTGDNKSPMLIDHRTGQAWVWRGSYGRATSGWYVMGGPEEEHQPRTIFDDIEDDIEAGRLDLEAK